jgi:hypothetical protein
MHKELNIRHSAFNQQIGFIQEQIFEQPPPYAEAAATSAQGHVETSEPGMFPEENQGGTRRKSVVIGSVAWH